MLDHNLQNPPFTTPPTLQGETIQIWITEPAGMVTWILPGIPVALQDVDLITVRASKMIRALKPPSQSWLFMHDFYHGSAAGTDIRKKLVDWGRTFKREEISRLVMSLGPEVPSFFRMTVNIGAMAMQLAGTKMKLVEDIRSEIAAEKMIPISIDDPRIAGL